MRSIDFLHCDASILSGAVCHRVCLHGTGLRLVNSTSTHIVALADVVRCDAAINNTCVYIYTLVEENVCQCVSLRSAGRFAV